MKLAEARLLSIGDMVESDNGPILGGTTSECFVTHLHMCSDGHVQAAWQRLNTSCGSQPAYSLNYSGRSWTDEERASILARMKSDETLDERDRKHRDKANEATHGIVMWARYWRETPNARHTEALRNAVDRYETAQRGQRNEMKTLLDKRYSGEEIADIDRAVHEAIEDADVPVDEHGFSHGEYRVVVTFEPEREASWKATPMPSADCAGCKRAADAQESWRNKRPICIHHPEAAPSSGAACPSTFREVRAPEVPISEPGGTTCRMETVYCAMRGPHERHDNGLGSTWAIDEEIKAAPFTSAPESIRVPLTPYPGACSAPALGGPCTRSKGHLSESHWHVGEGFDEAMRRPSEASRKCPSCDLPALPNREHCSDYCFRATIAERRRERASSDEEDVRRATPSEAPIYDLRAVKHAGHCSQWRGGIPCDCGADEKEVRRQRRERATVRGVETGVAQDPKPSSGGDVTAEGQGQAHHLKEQRPLRPLDAGSSPAPSLDSTRETPNACVRCVGGLHGKCVDRDCPCDCASVLAADSSSSAVPTATEWAGIAGARAGDVENARVALEAIRGLVETALRALPAAPFTSPEGSKR